MKYFLIIISLVIHSYSYAQEALQDSLEIKTFYFGDGSISSRGTFKNGQPDGYWKSYYPNGHLKSEGNRVASQLDGQWIFYSENKDTIEIIHYRNETKNGWNIKYKNNKIVSKELFLDGKIISLAYYFEDSKLLEVPYKKGVKHGLAFEYKDSLIQSIVEYKNGFRVSVKTINQSKNNLKQGPWLEFYTNRNIHKEYNYVNDTLDGFYREYDQQGHLLKNIFYEKGIVKVLDSPISVSTLKQEFYKNGNLKTEGYYENNIPVGMHKELSQDGILIEGILYDEEGHLIGKGSLDEQGRREGKWTFYEEQRIISEGFYKKGNRHKEWIFFYENGGIEQKGSYKNGFLSGEWIQYFENGTVYKIESYKKDLLDGEFIQNKPSGELFIKCWYSDNILDKEWILYYDFVVIHRFYKNGEKNGKWYSKFINGKLAYEGTFESNMPNDRHVYYYRTGLIKEEEYYIFGSKEKIWTKYDEFGLPIISFLYKNNELIKVDGYKFKFNN